MTLTLKNGDENRNEFGRLVAHFRIQRGMTQEDLGKAIEKDQRYVSKIENGRCEPSIKVLGLVARSLDFAPQELALAMDLLVDKNQAKRMDATTTMGIEDFDDALKSYRYSNESGDTEAALRYAKAARVLARNNDQRTSAAIVLGSAYSNMERFEAAEFYFDEARGLSTDPETSERVYANIAECLRRRGKTRRARLLAREIAIGCPIPRFRAFAMITLARALRDEGVDGWRKEGLGLTQTARALFIEDKRPEMAEWARIFEVAFSATSRKNKLQRLRSLRDSAVEREDEADSTRAAVEILRINSDPDEFAPTRILAEKRGWLKTLGQLRQLAVRGMVGGTILLLGFSSNSASAGSDKSIYSNDPLVFSRANTDLFEFIPQSSLPYLGPGDAIPPLAWNPPSHVSPPVSLPTPVALCTPLQRKCV